MNTQAVTPAPTPDDAARVATDEEGQCAYCGFCGSRNDFERLVSSLLRCEDVWECIDRLRNRLTAEKDRADKAVALLQQVFDGGHLDRDMTSGWMLSNAISHVLASEAPNDR